MEKKTEEAKRECRLCKLEIKKGERVTIYADDKTREYAHRECHEAAKAKAEAAAKAAKAPAKK